MIIGITGKAGSGKNTLAELIVKLYPEYKFEIVAFADKVKQVYSLIIGEEIVDTPAWKSEFLPAWGMTRREMLQRIGTDAMRDNLHKDVWVKALFSGFKPEKNYIITDVRFLNEALEVRDKGGIVIRVKRDNAPQIAESNHPSETELDDQLFFTVDNSGAAWKMGEAIKILF